MSDNTQPDGTVERNPAPEFKATDRMKELTAALSQLAQSTDDMSAKLANMEKIQAEMRTEREKMRPVNGPEAPTSRKSIDEVMTRKAWDSDEKQAQELNDRAIDRAIYRACKAGMISTGSEVNLKRIPREVWDSVPEVQELRQKAAGSWWDSTTGTSLDEWVPVQISQQALPFFTVDYDLPSLFDNVTIPRGVESVSVPVETTRAYAVIESQTTAAATATANVVNTAIANTALGAVCTLSPKKMSNAHGLSMEAVEDVAVDLLARSRENSARAVRAGLCEAIINGQDTDDADLDDATGASGLFSANGWSNADGDNGLRLHCVLNTFTTSLAGGSIDSGDVISAMGDLGKYGARPEDLVFLTSPAGAIGMLADPAVKTLDTFGPSATIFSGELGKVVGVPVIATSEFPQNIAATGIDAGTGALTGGILVNRRRWLFGSARALEQTFVPQPGYDAAWVITRARADFKIAVTNEHNAHYLINVAV